MSTCTIKGFGLKQHPNYELGKNIISRNPKPVAN